MNLVKEILQLINSNFFRLIWELNIFLLIQIILQSKKMDTWLFV